MITKEALIVGFLAIGMIIMGCDDNRPRPEKVDASSNRDYDVSRLFTDDQGCVVHRFGDAGYWHYYVTCPDNRQVSTQTNYSRHAGKIVHHVNEDIATLYK